MDKIIVGDIAIYESQNDESKITIKDIETSRYIKIDKDNMFHVAVTLLTQSSIGEYKTEFLNEDTLIVTTAGKGTKKEIKLKEGQKFMQEWFEDNEDNREKEWEGEDQNNNEKRGKFLFDF